MSWHKSLPGKHLSYNVTMWVYCSSPTVGRCSFCPYLFMQCMQGSLSRGCLSMNQLHIGMYVHSFIQTCMQTNVQACTNNTWADMACSDMNGKQNIWKLSDKWWGFLSWEVAGGDDWKDTQTPTTSERLLFSSWFIIRVFPKWALRALLAVVQMQTAKSSPKLVARRPAPRDMQTTNIDLVNVFDPCKRHRCALKPQCGSESMCVGTEGYKRIG